MEMEKLQVVINSQDSDLKAIAHCHMMAFPNSLSSRLGLRYCIKMLEWYLVANNRFLFHLESENKVIGYCGGFIRKGEPHGSSTGMTQHAFKEGIQSLIVRPWLLFHPEVKKNYRFLFRNLWLRVRGVSKRKSAQQFAKYPTEIPAGLVVIGVDPVYQGKHYGSILLQEFERISKSKGVKKITLSVKSNNIKAIKSYTRNGWLPGSVNQDSLHMYKEI